jgi:hypothetical protein
MEGHPPFSLPIASGIGFSGQIIKGSKGFIHQEYFRLKS